MSKLSLSVAVAALTFFTATAVAQGAVPLNVRGAMQRDVNPAVMSIWDVTNNAMNDEGGVDPAQMDAAKWAQVAEGAERLAASGKAMAEASVYVAAATGDTQVAEGEVPMEAVQRHIDSDPRLFGHMGAALAAHADKLAVSARAQDAAATSELVAELDGVCESCHARFWYPE
jgi:cytochrome c556